MPSDTTTTTTTSSSAAASTATAVTAAAATKRARVDGEQEVATCTMTATGFAFPWAYSEATLPAGALRAPHTRENKPVPALFRPLQIRGLTLKNRIGVSPMCMYSCKDGFLTDFHLVHLGQYALGGVGLIIQEATAIEPRGRITPYCAGLWRDEHIAPTKRVVDFIHAHNCAASIQLAHAGRKSSGVPPFINESRLLADDASEGGWSDDCVAASAIPFDAGWPVPRALTRDEIRDVIEKFRAATKRALACGYDMVEIHGAHGYLVGNFLSPASNKRTDEYGGSFENRCRFLLEVVAAVRSVWPADRPLSVRISCTDWTDDGWTLEETLQLTQQLIEAGVDIVDTSSGGNDPKQKITVSPGYQVPMSAAIKKKYANAVLTSPVGLITTPQLANSIVESGDGDLVLLGREFLRDPHWTMRAAQVLGADIAWAPQYSRARPFRNL